MPAAAQISPFDPLIQAIVDGVVAQLGPTAKPRKRLYKTDQAAEYLGVSPDVVKEKHAARELPSVGLLERQLLFDIEDLDAIIAANKERW